MVTYQLFISITCDWNGCRRRESFAARTKTEARKKARARGWSSYEHTADRCPAHKGKNKRGDR